MRKERLMLTINQLNRTLVKRIGHDFEQYGITPTEFKILSHLRIQGSTKTQTLGDIAFITSGAITYMIKKLKTKSYIQTSLDQKDKRITWVKLSDEGRTFYDEMYPKHLAYLDQVFKEFTDEEIEHVYQHIKSFEKKLRKE